jgi:hypothetical protein
MAAVVAALSLGAFQSEAQSLKDIFSKENMEKAAAVVTGENLVKLAGSWSYTGSAVEFESQSLLAKAGGTVASNSAEEKLNGYLEKGGIKPGALVFTFNADSTFTAKASAKSTKGSYHYEASTKTLTLKFAKIGGLKAKVTAAGSTMALLFKADKLLKLLTYLSSKSNNASLKSINALAGNYDGMMLGLTLKKE